MNKEGQILIIEDDKDDQEIFALTFKILKTKNEILFFDDGDAILLYLENNRRINPFLIISDINLPKLSGLQLRDKIYEDKELSLRCIPYLFFTSSGAQKDVMEAYSKSAQGFFVKPFSLVEYEEMIGLIINYWKCCKSPNRS